MFSSVLPVNGTTRPCNNLTLLVYSEWAFFGAHPAFFPMGIGVSLCVRWGQLMCAAIYTLAHIPIWKHRDTCMYYEQDNGDYDLSEVGRL